MKTHFQPSRTATSTFTATKSPSHFSPRKPQTKLHHLISSWPSQWMLDHNGQMVWPVIISVFPPLCFL